MCPYLPLASRDTCLGGKLTPACHTAGIARKLRPARSPEESRDPHKLCLSHRSHLYKCLTGTATYSCPPGWFIISHYSLYRPDRAYRCARLRSLRTPPIPDWPTSSSGPKGQFCSANLYHRYPLFRCVYITYSRAVKHPVRDILWTPSRIHLCKAPYAPASVP
jgi:hypothetical protein